MNKASTEVIDQYRSNAQQQDKGANQDGIDESQDTNIVLQDGSTLTENDCLQVFIELKEALANAKVSKKTWGQHATDGIRHLKKEVLAFKQNL